MIQPQSIYYPMYLRDDFFILLVTGGRGSGKSFNVATFIKRLTYETGRLDARKIAHQILYARYTMTSASISIIPEFLEKVELDGDTKNFKATKTDVINKRSGSHIMFRGIKTSSGNQTAKLKSIYGISVFVCDEAEEWTDEESFDKIMLSIRQAGIRNLIIIIMNPCDSNHWVYKRFIEKNHKIVEYDGVPVQISTAPNVLHIHTTYLDNKEHLSKQFLEEVERMKAENPEKYAHVVIGRWADVAEGAVFKKWGIVDEFPQECKKVGIGLDFGFSIDPTAAVRCGIVDGRLYLDEITYQTGMLSTDIVKTLRPWGLKTIADSADPRLIQEIHNGGVRIYAVAKGAGSINAGIDKMQSMEIFVTKRSYNLQKELRNYVWAKDKDGRYINEPEDANNHCFRGDTLVTTIHGDIPIKDIHEGDYVLTSKGWRKVLRKFNNGVRKVVEKEVVIGFEKITFFATLEHKFKVNGKWKKYGKLTKKDRLCVLLSSKEQSLKDTQTGNIQTTISTNGKRKGSIIARCCITPFMSRSTEKYQKGKSFIMSTITPLTMTSPTLWLLQDTNTICSIRRKLKKLIRKGSIKRALIQSQIGKREGRKLCRDYNQNQGYANSAERNLSQQMFTKDSVASNVIINGNTHLPNATLNSRANTVERSLWATNISNQNVVRKPAHITYQQITDVKTKSESYCEVYDLMVEDVHEYFANGILVHNCIDAARYYVLGELLGRIQKPKSYDGIFTH